MKINFLLFFFLIITSSSYSQNPRSNCNPVGNMESIYRNDAYRLATKRVRDINSPWKDSVNIPEIYIDSIAKAFYAIQNMPRTPLKDTLLNIFGYTTFNISYPGSYRSDSTHSYNAGDSLSCSQLKKIIVTVNNNASWANDWIAARYGNTINDTVNYLIQSNGLKVISSSLNDWPLYTDKKIYEITSPKAINTVALSNFFSKIYGTSYSHPDSYVGDGNYILADFINGDIILTYRAGCGDCPVGCTYGRAWKFKVNTSSDCSVNLISVIDWGIATMMPDIYNVDECLGIDSNYTPTVFKLRTIRDKNFPRITWQIKKPENIFKYVVERSSDGKTFAQAGEVYARAENNNEPYLWTDPSLQKSKHFYRVKAINATGASIDHSDIVSIENNNATSMNIYPTLISGRKINVQLNNIEPGQYSVTVINTTGQLVFRANKTIINRVAVLPIDLSSKLQNGLYKVIIQNKDYSFKQSIILQ